MDSWIVDDGARLQIPRMKVISRLLAVTALLFFAPLALAENKAEWLKDYDAAVKTAADKKKPVLVIFTNSTTCAPCKILKREVLSKPAFAKYADENLILLQVDYAPYFDKENKKDMKEIEAEQGIPKELWMRGRGPWPWMFVIAPDGKKQLFSGKAYDKERATPETFITFLKGLK